MKPFSLIALLEWELDLRLVCCIPLMVCVTVLPGVKWIDFSVFSWSPTRKCLKELGLLPCMWQCGSPQSSIVVGHEFPKHWRREERKKNTGRKLGVSTYQDTMGRTQPVTVPPLLFFCTWDVYLAESHLNLILTLFGWHTGKPVTRGLGCPISLNHSPL